MATTTNRRSQNDRVSILASHLSGNSTSVSTGTGPLVWVPGQNFLQGNFAPVHQEFTEVELHPDFGEIPPDLDGQFVRNGANPQFDLSGKPYHWFDGDGMLHAVQTSGGEATYTNRYGN
jgi:carotenoid cleavage dioxygenase-like enzyme